MHSNEPDTMTVDAARWRALIEISAFTPDAIGWPPADALDFWRDDPDLYEVERVA